MSNDAINHPSHYTTGKVEVIEYIEDKLTIDQLEGYFVGNIIKYMSRYKHKNGVEDLKKAAWYLNRLIGRLEREQGKASNKTNLCPLRKTECYNEQCKRSPEDHYFNQCWSNTFVHYRCDNKKVERSCLSCKHREVDIYKNPCDSCVRGGGKLDYWVAKEGE